MQRITFATAGALAVAAGAHAQNTGINLTDGTATYRIGGGPNALNTTPAVTVPPTMDLFLVGTTTENLYNDWWWFRGPGDSRESAIANATSRTPGAANEVEYGYTLGSLTGTLSFTVTQPGANTARVDQLWTIRNPGPSPVQLELFHYIDFDLAGTTSNSATLAAPNNRITITHSGGTTADWLGTGAAAYQVTPFATVRGLLTNTVINDLNNTGLPFGPGDWTGAMQWSLSIPAGGQVQAFSSYGINTPAVPGPTGCYPDCDTSTGPGVLDIFDFLCFQNRYDVGSPYACECDTSTGPGVCDIFDFLCFQNAYDAGCP